MTRAAEWSGRRASRSVTSAEGSCRGPVEDRSEGLAPSARAGRGERRHVFQFQEFGLVAPPGVPDCEPSLGNGEERRVVGGVAYRNRRIERGAEFFGAGEDGVDRGALVGSPRYGDPPSRTRGGQASTM